MDLATFSVVASLDLPARVDEDRVGDAVIENDEVLILSPYRSSYFRTSTRPPFVVTETVLSRAPKGIASVGGQAFLRFSSDPSQILAHASGRTDSTISVGSPARGFATGWGKLYVSTSGGQISEIDPGTRTEIRRLAACPTAAAPAVVGSQTVLSACGSGGIGVLDLMTSSFVVESSALVFSEVAGKEGQPYALVSQSNFGASVGDGATRVFSPGGGFAPSAAYGVLSAPPAFIGSHAIATKVRFADLYRGWGEPTLIDLTTGHEKSLPGFTLMTPGNGPIEARVVSTGSMVLIANGEDGAYKMLLDFVDGATGVAVHAPVTLPPPPSLPPN